MLPPPDDRERRGLPRPARNYLERRLTRFFRGAPTIRSAGSVIVLITTLTVLAAGAVMRIFDHSEFSSYGISLWWALQTVTTVGYGDIVPANAIGRIIGAIVMLEGIAFLTVITAAVTSIFIERARRDRMVAADHIPDNLEDAIISVDERLRRIEQRLESL